MTTSPVLLKVDYKISELCANPRDDAKWQGGGGCKPAGRGIQSCEVSCIQHPVCYRVRSNKGLPKATASVKHYSQK